MSPAAASPLPPEARHIVLVGLPAAGKTSVGALLASRLGRPFADSDQAAERRLGTDVATIFERSGEAHFRALEREIIADLLAMPAQVIALGGGAFCDAETRRLVAARGFSIWLAPPLDILAARLRGETGRPLFAHGDARAVLRRLAAARRATLSEADICVRDANPDDALASILRQLPAPLRGEG